MMAENAATSMSTGRPEILFPLFANVTTLGGIGEKSARLFERLGAPRLIDLALLLPTGLVDRRQRETAAGAAPGEVVTVGVTVLSHRPGSAPNRPTRVQVEDAGLAFDLVYFRPNRDWLERTLPVGAHRIVSGKVEYYDDRVQMAHPDWVLSPERAETLPEWEPVYPLTAGLTQRAMTRAVAQVLGDLPALDEWIPPSVSHGRAWPRWEEAVRLAHAPAGHKGLALDDPARQRLAFDELFSHQLTLALVRASVTRGRGQVNVGDGHLRASALQTFGYPPTTAQSRAIDEILADMGGERRMMRLLQGDVGSGKTLVAMMAMLAAVEAGGQAALMAPTEILARQHAAGLQQMADAAGVSLVLLTGRDKGAIRARKLAEIADGTAGLVLGTHALFQRDVAFSDLRLVIVDEQHRFGVRQRMELTEKAPVNADVLVMTATPIPRTLALAGFGDLDISILDEKPPGRQPIATAMVSNERYDDVLQRLRHAIAEGHRAYWVCPLVEESDVSDMMSAETRFERLADALGPENVRLVHGQMPSDDKDRALGDFQNGTAQVLVATTVVEVGVDVPEATIIVIEHAETFGLAQLHQLRGRVGRGREKSACVLLYASPLGETARARLQILRETEDGFRIAEEDLKIRGAGDVLGTAQSGVPQFRIADVERDTALMDLARDAARLVLRDGTGLDPSPTNPLRTLLYLMERDDAVRLMRVG